MKTAVRTATLAMAVLLVTQQASSAPKGLPIIPGAAGFGMETPAGSGRHLEAPKTAVYKVTNLKDSGPGSLREAIQAKGSRVVVFEVSGYIDPDGGLSISNPYLTVAGETAPWPGIVVRGGFAVEIRAHDVLIRHMGFRTGDSIKGWYMPHRGCLGVGGRNVVRTWPSMADERAAACAWPPLRPIASSPLAVSIQTRTTVDSQHRKYWRAKA